MGSYLYQVISGLSSLLVFFIWVRPQAFKFLLDKDSDMPSLGRQGQYTALIVSTWGFVSLILSDKMNEWFFTGYMLAWAGAQFGSIWLKVKGQQQAVKV